MDTAVALVEAYLYANGYFTVTEYPVMEQRRDGRLQSATDVDILAVRFPGAGRFIPDRRHRLGGRVSRPDGELDVGDDRIDMIIGEVKQGEAVLNRGAREPDILRAALTRFGTCAAEHAQSIVDQLLHDGEAIGPAGPEGQPGPRVRLFGFGSRYPRRHHGYRIITLGHIIDFLRQAGRDWQKAGTQFRHPALEFLSLMAKARRGE
jgi:hypothetical protein